jgi:hypothetical protein
MDKEYNYIRYSNIPYIDPNIISSIVHFLKTCYYSGEIDKFIRYINDNLPDVRIQ